MQDHSLFLFELMLLQILYNLPIILLSSIPAYLLLKKHYGKHIWIVLFYCLLSFFISLLLVVIYPVIINAIIASIIVIALLIITRLNSRHIRIILAIIVPLMFLLTCYCLIEAYIYHHGTDYDWLKQIFPMI